MPKNYEPTDICAVVVTYGNRGDMCTAVAQAVLSMNIGRVIIVDNGSLLEASKTIQRFQEMSGGRVHVLRHEENLGSAGGYRSGIEFAQTSHYPLIWLLDDDNLPDWGCVEEALRVRVEAERQSGSRIAVSCFRRSHAHFREMRDGRPVKAVHPGHSSFLGFSILDSPKYVSRRLAKLVPPSKPRAPYVKGLPFAPYGGLLISQTLVSEIGLPREEFFVYMDDTEWTSRIVMAGGSIYLSLGAGIEDLHSNTEDVPYGDIVALLLTAQSTKLLEYRIRNQAYFESHCWTSSRTLYRANRAMRFVLLYFDALRARRPDLMALIRRAVSDGEHERLGPY